MSSAAKRTMMLLQQETHTRPTHILNDDDPFSQAIDSLPSEESQDIIDSIPIHSSAPPVSVSDSTVHLGEAISISANATPSLLQSRIVPQLRPQDIARQQQPPPPAQPPQRQQPPSPPQPPPKQREFVSLLSDDEDEDVTQPVVVLPALASSPQQRPQTPAEVVVEAKTLEMDDDDDDDELPSSMVFIHRSQASQSPVRHPPPANAVRPTPRPPMSPNDQSSAPLAMHLLDESYEAASFRASPSTAASNASSSSFTASPSVQITRPTTPEPAIPASKRPAALASESEEEDDEEEPDLPKKSPTKKRKGPLASSSASSSAEDDEDNTPIKRRRPGQSRVRITDDDDDDSDSESNKPRPKSKRRRRTTAPSSDDDDDDEENNPLAANPVLERAALVESPPPSSDEEESEASPEAFPYFYQSNDRPHGIGLDQVPLRYERFVSLQEVSSFTPVSLTWQKDRLLLGGHNSAKIPTLISYSCASYLCLQCARTYQDTMCTRIPACVQTPKNGIKLIFFLF